MRKVMLSLMLSLLSCSTVSAFWPEALDSAVEVGVGYRNDSIKWKRELSGGSSYYGSSSGSGSGSSGARETSDFNWKDLNIWFIEGRGRYVTCDCIYIRGRTDYGWITSGKLHHKNHFGSGGSGGAFDENDFSSSSPSSRGNGHAKGFVYDCKLAIGYQFKWCDECLAVAPLIGYSWHGQHLRGGKDHEHSNFYYDESSSDECSDNSSYSSYSSSSSSGHNKHRFNDRWNGVFIGFDLDYRLCCEWNLFMNYEYHWAEFHATEHNRTLFRNEFNGSGCGNIHRSTIHANNGYGNVLGFGAEWDLCECWTLGLRAEFQWWYANKGHERTKFAEASLGNVEFEGVAKSRVKHISWDSGSIAVELGMIF